MRELSRTVVLGLLAVVVIALTLFGTLDELWGWVRGLVQAVGTVAGIYLGARWQAKDDGSRVEGAARTAVVNMVALADGIQVLIANAGDHRNRLSALPPRTVESSMQASEAFVAGVDGQARSLLGQARAAARTWLQFVPNPDQYLTELAGDGRD